MNPWLPKGFEHPRRVSVPPDHHLRPIRPSDVDIDYPAVMASRQRLWSIFGEPHGWPAESLTYEDDLVDLIRHEAEMDENLSFDYALLDQDESHLAERHGRSHALASLDPMSRGRNGYVCLPP